MVNEIIVVQRSLVSVGDDVLCAIHDERCWVGRVVRAISEDGIACRGDSDGRGLRDDTQAAKGKKED